MRFAGKTILVTGAASGIGRAAAEALAGEGAGRLILVDVDATALGGFPRLAGNTVFDFVPGDVADEAFWNTLGPHLAGLDHAIVNAGIAGAGAIATLDFAEWRRILRVNLDGAFLTLRAAMLAMATRGGSVVTTSSAAGIKAEPGTAPYAASKAALNQLVKVAAKEGAADGIRVNAVAPGGVETPVWDAVPMFADRAAAIGRDAAFAEMAKFATPLGRYAKPEEIARQMLFLLSDDAAFITGATLVSDGGYTL